MELLLRVLGSSIGKKLMMAVTGLSFVFFLLAHLAGNLTITAGADAFNGYAARLHALGPVLTVAELVLLGFFLVHVCCGLYLFWQNFRARPERYCVDRRAGGRTLASAMMPYTGLAILFFVLWHLLQFHFVDKSHVTIFALVSGAFSDPLTVVTYVAAMGVVGLHVSHGFWSLFQTLGLNHPRWMPAVRSASPLLALGLALGFGFLPIYLLLGG
jgi:succinate dehydrogenase / fumarate reductase cytochrome b subunit